MIASEDLALLRAVPRRERGKGDHLGEFAGTEPALPMTFADWLLVELLSGEGTPEHREYVARKCAEHGIAIPLI